MKILGRQFVFGRTIDEALNRAAPERERGLTHSFDMLGEAARTHRRRRALSPRPMPTRSTASPRKPSGGFRRSPGISVKLSALHPRYELTHAEEAKAAMLPVLRELALKASAADVHFTIDAEEADRLELSLDMFEALLADDELVRQRLGRVRARASRPIRSAPCRCATGSPTLARAHGRKLMVRLVKGAYWDTEIKAAQVAGLTDYPVFTRKVATDVSYLACAKKLLAASDVIYPAFATHNANTIGAIKALAGKTPFEFQRLHGMGEGLYEELAKLERGDRRRARPRCGSTRRSAATRNCSPISSAACSRTAPTRRFVNRIADERGVARRAGPRSGRRARGARAQAQPGDPAAARDLRRGAAQQRRGRPVRSAGARAAARAAEGARKPQLDRQADAWEGRRAGPVTSPHDRRIDRRRRCSKRAPRTSTAWSAPAHAAQPDWDALGGEARARLLDRTADLYEEHREEFFSLCIREAGKTLIDAVLEVREAVDFLRFYASEARRQFTRPMPLPGPTGEQNELRLHGRGVFASISPVEFPAGDLHRPGFGAAGRGQCRDRQAGRANAADRRARGRADAPGGHPQGRRPARARRKAGSSAER